MRCRFPGLVVLASALVASVSYAAPDPAEVDRLLQAFQGDETELATEECTGACRALSSMQRSADRICALEPGPRCEDARARVKAARAKVVTRCPACVVASPGADTSAPPALPAPPPAKGGGPTADRESVATANVPEEKRRGGCAGCSSSGVAADAGAIAVLALALSWALGRRRDRRTERRG